MALHSIALSLLSIVHDFHNDGVDKRNARLDSIPVPAARRTSYSAMELSMLSISELLAHAELDFRLLPTC